MVSPDRTTRQQQARNRALYLPEELRQRNIQALSEVGKSREGRRHSPGLHLPHVLALKVDHALWARAELGHREPLLLTELADPFSHFAEEARLAGAVRVPPRPRQAPLAARRSATGLHGLSGR